MINISSEEMKIYQKNLCEITYINFSGFNGLTVLCSIKHLSRLHTSFGSPSQPEIKIVENSNSRRHKKKALQYTKSIPFRRINDFD